MKQKQKALRRSLWASVLAIVFCVAMLLGTTFAWFTDTVSSTGNKIQSGTLDIDLNDGATEPLFKGTADILWEPGFSQKATAKLTNTGSLWLKYALQVTNLTGADEANLALADVLDVYISDTEIKSAADLTEANKVGTVAQLAKNPAKLPDGNTFGTLEPNGGNKTLYLAIKMQELAGNQYQGKSIEFAIEVAATQYTKEEDGFGNPNYDADAPLEFTPVSTLADLQKALSEGGNVILTQDITATSNVRVTKDTNIDLNGNTLTSSGTGSVLDVHSGEVTVSNGTIKLGNSANYSETALYAGGDSNVTIENCTIETEKIFTYPFSTNGTYSQNATIVIRNSTIKTPTADGSRTFAAYIPAGNVTLENCDVTGYICISGGNVTLDGGTYTSAGINGQDHIWTGPQSAEFIKGKEGNALSFGDSILVIDRRSGYTASDLTIRNITFNTEITLKDGTKANAYAIRYIDMSANEAASPVHCVIENNTYNHKIDGEDPLMFIDKNGNEIAAP